MFFYSVPPFFFRLLGRGRHFMATISKKLPTIKETRVSNETSQGNKAKEGEKATEGSMASRVLTSNEIEKFAASFPAVPNHVPLVGTMDLASPISVTNFNFGSETSPFDVPPPSDVPVVSFQIETEKSPFDDPPPVETSSADAPAVETPETVYEKVIYSKIDLPKIPSSKIDLKSNIETKKDSEKNIYPKIPDEIVLPLISLDELSKKSETKNEVDPKFDPKKLEIEFQELKKIMKSNPLINQKRINKLIDLMERKPAEFNECIDEWLTLVLHEYKPSRNQSKESRLLMDELSKIDTSSFEQNKYIFMKLIHAQGHSEYQSAGLALHHAIFKELLWSIDYFKFLHKERIESEFKNLSKVNPDSYKREINSIQSSAVNQSLISLRTLCENNPIEFNRKMNGINLHLKNLSSDSYKSSSSKVLLIKVQELLKSKLRLSETEQNKEILVILEKYIDFTKGNYGRKLYTDLSEFFRAYPVEAIKIPNTKAMSSLAETRKEGALKPKMEGKIKPKNEIVTKTKEKIPKLEFNEANLRSDLESLVKSNRLEDEQTKRIFKELMTYSKEDKPKFDHYVRTLVNYIQLKYKPTENQSRASKTLMENLNSLDLNNQEHLLYALKEIGKSMTGEIETGFSLNFNIRYAFNYKISEFINSKTYEVKSSLRTLGRLYVGEKLDEFNFKMNQIKSELVKLKSENFVSAESKLLLKEMSEINDLESVKYKEYLPHVRNLLILEKIQVYLEESSGNTGKQLYTQIAKPLIKVVLENIATRKIINGFGDVLEGQFDKDDHILEGTIRYADGRV